MLTKGGSLVYVNSICEVCVCLSVVRHPMGFCLSTEGRMSLVSMDPKEKVGWEDRDR